MSWHSETEGLAKQAGFTLAETLVALAILSLAVGLVAGLTPKQNQERTLRVDAAQIIEAARTARLTALHSNSAVAFDPLAHTSAKIQAC
ncbi:MAG: type II secretion system protein, partial [Pseudomonadota bacterium]